MAPKKTKKVRKLLPTPLPTNTHSLRSQAAKPKDQDAKVQTVKDIVDPDNAVTTVRNAQKVCGACGFLSCSGQGAAVRDDTERQRARRVDGAEF